MPDTMARCLVAVLVIGVCAHVAVLAARPDRFPRDESPIVLPPSYEATYTYTIPYTATYLPDGPLSYPVHLWVNGDHDMTRLDTYDGLDSELHRDRAVYFRVPRIDEYACMWWRTGRKLLHEQAHTTPANLLSAVLRAPGTEPVLKEGGGMPDFEEWKFDKDLEFNGVEAERWTYKVKIEERVGNYVVIVSKQEHFPLYLHMLGGEIVAGAHYDEYVMNFTSFKAAPSNDLSAFDVPTECGVESLQSTPSRPLSLALASLMPGAALGRTDYSNFREQHGREAEDESTHMRRAYTYLHHSAAVKRHNLQKDRRFTMALNKFADWGHAEFSGSMLGFRRSEITRATIAAVQAGYAAPPGSGRRSKFQHTPGFSPTPGSLDWRESGAVGPVKDQGVCGSCWSFSASQAISSAHWMATGEYTSLSEQQIMDCSWDYGLNSACNGGDPDLAVQYSIDTGGSFSEFDYPYKGVDDFCKAGSLAASAGPVVTPAEVVYIESQNVEAVKQALAKHGPVSVGVDAEPVAFRFYSDGVLDTPDCSSAAEAIDHAVLLVGYGEEDGVPYWTLKNEWSAHWGDAGYIKVAQANDCGIATEAFFVIANTTQT